MSNKNLLNRNDVAAMINCTVDVVRKNERRLGLLEYKVAINRRNIFYKRAGVLKSFTALGLIDPKA